MLLLNTLTIVCMGLLAGAEFAVSAFINPALWKLDDRAQARAVGLFAAKLGAAMPFWYISSLVLLLMETFVQRNGGGESFFIAASVIWVAVIVFTLIWMVPINNQLTKVRDSLTDEDRRKHKRWDSLHHNRIAAVTASLILLILGTYR